MMKTSLKGLAFIAGLEGIVLRPYLDSVGVWTIGIGHTAAAGPPDPGSLPRDRDLSMDAVFELFGNDIKKYEDRVLAAVHVSLKQHQFDALVSFDYNTGGIHKAQLTKKLNAGDFQGAADGFMGWLKPESIRGRRTKEMQLFRDGTYGNGRATVYPVKANGVPDFRNGAVVNVLAMLGTPHQPDDPGAEPTTQRRGLLQIILDFILRLFGKER